ncbi:FAD-binding oxidoreductase [Bacillus sp. FJAT-45066]|uniref:FAD-binding oxidoreductase n=1 Tax=Bacillus sp. FJAT-45066 TaxID=2011010 RepID=UPI000BB8839C|nr:FAD-binding oxidoreductase [Bacillus sp. FJAT-45066]
MKIKTMPSKLIIGFLIVTMLYSSLLFYSFTQKDLKDELLIHDVSRLFPEKVMKIVEGKELESIEEAVRNACENNLKISIAGTRHSQGGHAFYKDSLWIDMSHYNKIVDFNEQEKTITVQSGVTWADIQEYINPYNLSVKVMQSSNIFSIGGSLSSNVHGRDPNFGPLIETVQSFRLLKENGTVLNVSRTENEELFPLVIGGFGLFGVILDVTLELTTNDLYIAETVKVDYHDYPAYFVEHIRNNPDVGLHFARLSVPTNLLLEELYMTTYKKVGSDVSKSLTEEQIAELLPLHDEKNVRRDKFVFGLSRHYDWGKALVWKIQQKFYAMGKEEEIISRNNAMRPPIQFLDYYSPKDTDILQEYFIPVDNFSQFVDELREIVIEDKLNLLNVTVRYTPANDEAYLSYTNHDTFALVLYFNQGFTEEEVKKMEQATQKMVDAALTLDGTYYLVYQLFPTDNQIRQAYPEIDSFFEMKNKYDPNERFMNNFYERYAKR